MVSATYSEDWKTVSGFENLMSCAMQLLDKSGVESFVVIVSFDLR